jgi:glycosyltransferase involved in cell wall biosynthesis
LLFPSETETFGNVLMEGMASGLAVLAYDAAAAAWHGRDGDNCLKVEKGNADDYLEAALRLTDPALRASLGTSARATAEGHSWPAVVADLEAHFRSIL